MKKLILIILFFVLANCEIGCRRSEADCNTFNCLHSKERLTIDGMEFMVFYVDYQTSQTGYDIEIVNLTKEKLEIELLKKQLIK